MDALIIFVKNPQLGKVKTRLAQSVGNQKALEIYQKLCAITEKAVAKIPCEKYLYYSDFIPVQDQWAATFIKKLQTGDDLGTRMLHAFQEISGLAQKMVIIGTDCPYIQATTIEQALHLLDDADIVIGPSIDGGYYLLGMKTVVPSLFRDIPWSTREVFQMTLDRCKEEELKVATLNELSDVDYLSDWEEFLKFQDHQKF